VTEGFGHCLSDFSSMASLPAVPPVKIVLESRTPGNKFPPGIFGHTLQHQARCRSQRGTQKAVPSSKFKVSSHGTPTDPPVVPASSGCPSLRSAACPERGEAESNGFAVPPNARPFSAFSAISALKAVPSAFQSAFRNLPRRSPAGTKTGPQSAIAFPPAFSPRTKGREGPAVPTRCIPAVQIAGAQ
jgi:hypothetical protein